MTTIRKGRNYRIEVRVTDHLPPHFHVIGPDFAAAVEIGSLRILAGDCPRRALDEAAGLMAEIEAEWQRLHG